MKVLITGATGLIGREVGKVLAQKGHDIFVISRDPRKAKELLPFPCEVIGGDLGQSAIHDERLAQIEGVMNLMGEPLVGGRWTEKKKARIYDSRIIGTRHLIASLPSHLKVFVSGSAIGYYGDCGDVVVREDHPPGTDFAARVCVEWEAEAAKAPGRQVLVRTGVVLAPFGGALQQMLFPFRAGVGGALADGQAWMSWIHLDDIVGILVRALEDPRMVGPVNGVAPHPVRNHEFSEGLAQALGKGLGPNVPALALKAVFGEASQVLLASLRASATRTQALGYEFKFSEVHTALQDVCESYQNGEEVFYAEQFLPYPPEEVFPFFRSAHNLERITPPSLKFKIEKISTAEVQQGTRIDYTLKIRGLPVRWKTEIDEWQPPHKFVDNQLAGPYRLWHHTHEFRPFCGGTLMVDRVRYRLPLGFVGWVSAGKLVRGDVEKIFTFRRRYVAAMIEEKRSFKDA